MTQSPSVILTCQFTLPNKKSFSTYIDYITREQALEEKERRTPEEEQELQRIKNALEEFTTSSLYFWQSLKELYDE